MKKNAIYALNVTMIVVSNISGNLSRGALQANVLYDICCDTSGISLSRILSPNNHSSSNFKNTCLESVPYISTDSSL